MRNRSSRYDGDLEMFVEPTCEPDLARLRFLRWLGERGRLEHAPVGTPAGIYAVRSAGDDGRADVRKVA